MKLWMWVIGASLSALVGGGLAMSAAPSPQQHFLSASRGLPKKNFRTAFASWYGRWHHGKLMANGRPFNMHAVSIAHKTLPLGTRVAMTNPETGTTVIASVTDRGPYISGREFDLSYETARQLGIVEQGVAPLRIEILQ